MPGTGGAPPIVDPFDFDDFSIIGAERSFVAVFLSRAPLVISAMRALYGDRLATDHHNAHDDMREPNIIGYGREDAPYLEHFHLRVLASLPLAAAAAAEEALPCREEEEEGAEEQA